MNKLVLIEAPQKGQIVMHLTPSLDADYVPILQCVGEGKSGISCRMIVKRKLGSADKESFGYKAEKDKQAAVIKQMRIY